MKSSSTPAAIAERELQRFRKLLLALRVLAKLRIGDRQQVLLWAGIVGIAGALAGQLFKEGTSLVQWLLCGRTGGFVATFSELPLWQRILVPTAGGLMAGLVLVFGQRLVKRSAPDYMEAVALGDGDLPVRASLVKSTSALFSIASGEAIGREGPLVQLAALSASLAGRLRRMSPARMRLIVACGAAAGIASAYHAPLGGALFVAEIVLGSIAIESFGPLLLASVTATLTTQAFEGVAPLYALPSLPVQGVREIAIYGVLGAACGAASQAWMHALRWAKRVFNAIAGPVWLRLTVGGLLVGLLAAWRPEVTGNGASLIRHWMQDSFSVQAVLLLAGMKMLATGAAFGSGAVGGVFTPSLFVGATLGWLLSWVGNAVWPELALSPACFAAVGMGAFLSASARAPIMAIVLLFEMTLAYTLVLPLIVAAVIAHGVARSLGSESLYSENLHAGPRSVFDRSLAEVCVRDLVRRGERWLSPTASFRQIAGRFLSSGNRELWITDDTGKWRGAVLLSDVEPFLKDAGLAETVIALDVARADLPTLRPNQSLPQALDLFSATQHDRLPVVSENGDFEGVIGRADLFLAISELTRRASAKAAYNG